MFFSGTLQEGIALALRESKAVICFVPDDSETSSTWQDVYFRADEQFIKLVEARSVLLRILKDSPEAGFLASVCPVSQYPTVVVIRNGTLREYIVPNISKDEFRDRLAAALDDSKPESKAAAPLRADQPIPEPEATSSSVSEPIVTTPTSTAAAAQIQSNLEQSSQEAQQSGPSYKGKERMAEVTSEASQKTVPPAQKEQHKPHPITSTPQEKAPKKEIKGNAPIRVSRIGTSAEEPSLNWPRPPAGPPTQYRLQVRLFDGSSVRSTFSPSHTVHKEVRGWLDSQLEEKGPYNLKLILTPLPNKTLTIAEEGQPLSELITGSTATFVMIPVRSYVQAYSESASLPVRAVSFVYNIVSSVVGTATGYLGSLLGFVQNRSVPSQTEPSQSNEPQISNDSTRHRRPFGPNIRTLRDQEGDQDRQFYNGNQLNFEPRRDDE
ncbi:hypothetical protein BJY04DRAFT_158173 [Aspergillus karnatakaensis]|uniref:UBX domain protein n=1 Tax=Aspergillus karnatakaensis TaxID=1810916 RepID=UPI003CCE28A1